MSADNTKGINFEVIKDTYIGCLKKYVVFSGRARRREFWIFFFCNLVIGLVLGWIPVIGWLISLAIFIPSISVGVRRLHDTNRSGKWYLLMLIPVVLLIIIGIIVAVIAATSYYSYSYYSGFWGIPFGMKHGILWGFLIVILILASLALGILLLVWAAQDGTHGSNRYGPDPKGKSKK